jgi:protein dithiol oxidoreductase (disulfide-forming)
MDRTGILFVGILLAISGFAGDAGAREGKHYAVLDPPRIVESLDKIEVTEFFYYGCRHCFGLERVIQRWATTLPEDVTFRRVPAVFPGNDGRPGPWANLARVYFTLEALGFADTLHGEVFNAIHVERLNLNDPNILRHWVASKGIASQKFDTIYNSSAIQRRILRAQELSQSYGFDGVPAIYVDGRYTPAGEEIRRQEDVIAVVDQLIAKARQDRAINGGTSAAGTKEATNARNARRSMPVR